MVWPIAKDGSNSSRGTLRAMERSYFDFALLQQRCPGAASHCLSFLDETAVLQIRNISQNWKSISEADPLWRPFARARWPSTDALFASGLLPGSMMQLYRLRLRMERCRPSRTELHRFEPYLGWWRQILEDIAIVVDFLTDNGKILHCGLHDVEASRETLVAHISADAMELSMDEIATSHLSIMVLQKRRQMCAQNLCRARCNSPEHHNLIFRNPGESALSYIFEGGSWAPRSSSDGGHAVVCLQGINRLRITSSCNKHGAAHLVSLLTENNSVFREGPRPRS